MDFYQLNTFYHVAQRLNFTRAAEDLNMSQSAVSRQIEALEKNLGLPLFNRIGRSVSLTEAGYVLYKQCEQILRLVEGTQAAIETLKNLESGSLRVGCSSTVGNYILPSVVLKFIRKYPGIQIHVNIDCTKHMLERAEAGDVDIAIIAGPIESNVLYVEPFLKDEIVLAMGKNHPLVGEDDILFDSLSQYPILVRSEGSHSRKTILQHFARIGWDTISTVEFDTTEAIKQAIIAGPAIGFLSKFSIHHEVQCGLMSMYDHEPYAIHRNFYIVSHKGKHPSPAMLAFKTFLRKHGIFYV
ncbi:LysR family transcriptional regulator [Fodinisporobacter ferrooxydans]|uniref:LysR family transcriptional regulator n=1 Tax=Fodinisporobacter ferrooxydans TaxID=2901836 RepID=A0ABY4CK38_9BACL|nr:LysR family transcriptional regulator [Alicyclobacillaceae bacterium MYW30-H2]